MRKTKKKTERDSVRTGTNRLQLRLQRSGELSNLGMHEQRWSFPTVSLSLGSLFSPFNFLSRHFKAAFWVFFIKNTGSVTQKFRTQAVLSEAQVHIPDLTLTDCQHNWGKLCDLLVFQFHLKKDKKGTYPEKFWRGINELIHRQLRPVPGTQ